MYAAELSARLNNVRQIAISEIKGYLSDNKIEELNCCEISSSTPMVTPTQSLDTINLYGMRLSFDASGEDDNNYYYEEEVSTDLLVDIVGFIEEHDKEIKEQYERE